MLLNHLKNKVFLNIPTDHYSSFLGARTVTSLSGKGTIVQHLSCEVSGCSWSILPEKLEQKVKYAAMMTLPNGYNC